MTTYRVHAGRRTFETDDVDHASEWAARGAAITARTGAD